MGHITSIPGAKTFPFRPPRQKFLFPSNGSFFGAHPCFSPFRAIPTLEVYLKVIMLQMPRMGMEMILKRKMPTSAEEERIIVEMPRVEVDVVTRSLDTAQTAITRIERKFSKDTSLQGCRMSFTDKS